ncbi:hypothetical protein [Lentzea flaviverrucosa]|uniref:Uncharacterized protein n=1 Tax=Lentzea flaviverrucosa TaxID=200379 RepID=A0A1H9CHD9_9PSEU|nr:hypothetical protein [Lentzea flaviverrucosa]RDI24550.1 hypothetical protein DFR72_109130 [Lentzea flaviverrucosa]SEQ00625.1 hypothetical protein SAMN05216195_101785 [Lentzea flaviverrucosa]
MRLVPLQWASLVVIFLDAVVIVSGFVTGSALLPRSANVVLTVISLALMSSTVVLARGGYNFEKPTLPAWSVVVAVIAFFGGAFLFAFPLLTDTTTLTMAENQRGWAGLALAFAGGTFVYAGIRHRK